MKIIKNSLCIATMAVLSFSMVSCENENIGTPASVSEVNDLNASHDDGLVHTRARSVSWIEKDYIPNLSHWYEVINASKAGTNTFSFKVNLKEWKVNHLEVYVKIYSPSGITNYEQMTRNGYVFNYQAQFWEIGNYYYRYFVRINANTYELTKLHDNSKSFTCLTIPTKNNDYEFPNGKVWIDADGRGFYVRECVSWVAWKVNQMWGTSYAFHNDAFIRRLGNAHNWKSVLEDSGYKVDIYPQPGDIAWWSNLSGQTDTNGIPYGHVAFVHEVYSDGSILLSEYNGNVDHGHGILQVPQRRKFPDAFIHVQFQK